MADQIRVAVIGAGAMGSNHIRVYKEMPDAELVAIADTRESLLSTARVRAYADYRRMLDEETLDAVSIAVPARTHFEVAMACIQHGVGALIEKPIAALTSEGEELRNVAEASRVMLMVGHIERFNPAVMELKRRIDAGELGRIYQARAQRVGPFFHRERDIGVAHDLATHDIDVLHYLLDSEVVCVSAETQSGITTGQEDTLAGTLLFNNGVVAQIEANWITPRKKRELTLLGERGVFAMDFITRSLTFCPTAGDREGDEQRLLIPQAGVEPLHMELAAFLHAIRSKGPVPVTAEQGTEAVRVADALVESGASGRAVQVRESRLVR